MNRNPVRIKRFGFCLLLTWMIAVIPVTAQVFYEKNFASYTTTDGLSDNNVTGIVQDATGYIWLSTYNGLNRYDGTRFVQYHSTNDSLSPASELMSRISRLDKERIAVHNTGLHIINTKNGKRKNLFIPYKYREYQYKFNSIERVKGDAAGNAYLLTRSGFYHFDKNYNLLYRFDFFSEKDLAGQHFHFGSDLIELDDERLLIAGRGVFYIYYKSKKNFKKLDIGEVTVLNEFLPDKKDHRVFELLPGHFFIPKINTDSIVYINVAQNKKVVSKAPFIFDVHTIQWRSKLVQVNDSVFFLTSQTAGFYKLKWDLTTGVIEIFNEKYFAGHLCHDILIDKDGLLWVATNKGLLRQHDKKSPVQVTIVPPEVEASLPNMLFASVYATSRKVYAGTRGQAGLMIFDKETFSYEKNLQFSYNPRSNSVFEIAPVNETALLLGTWNPLLLYDEKKGAVTQLQPREWTKSDWTNCLFKDSRNNIWVSAAKLYRYNLEQKQYNIIPVNIPMPSVLSAIQEDKEGNLWMAGHGMIRYNTALNRFDEKIDSFPYIKIPDKQIASMAIDNNNTVWVGCNNNGLIGYNIRNKTFKHFTRKDGLPDDNVSSLIVVGNNLWIACYSGIACLKLERMKLVSFGKDEGFPDMPVQKGSDFFYDSTDRQLYIGFHRAVVRFNPFTLTVNEKKPSVFIESVKTGSTEALVLPGNEMTTSWKLNDLLFTIGSINFSDGSNHNYAYRINEKSEWQQLGSQQSFSVSNLAAGKHNIQVKIFSLKNSWPEQVTTITVEVLPPFWQTTWFRILAAILLLVAIYLFIHRHIKFIRKKEMEKTQVEKLKADDYKNRYELEQISHYFSSSIAGKKTIDEVLWDVAANLIGRMNYVDCMIYMWNNDKMKMVQKASYGPKGKPEYLFSDVFDVAPGQGVVGYVMQTKQPVLIKDTTKDSRYRVDDVFRLSEICVPIIHNNELLGILDSEHPEVNYFTERDIKILTTIATLIGNKIKQIESEQTLEVKQKELTTINEQLAEAKLSALQAQMNPHFIFNALNSIKQMILDGDDEKASRYLSKFALMIRMTLNHSKDAFVTLAENIEYIKTYLGMEQLRFDDSFNWNISVAENIDTEEINIPSLMIQPLVENAIWHGLLQSEGDKRLSIAFTQTGNIITCIIEDNGIGINQSEKQKKFNGAKHRSVGLGNLRNRIKILNEKYGTECSLVIADLKETENNKSGTRVTLKFNIINT